MKPRYRIRAVLIACLFGVLVLACGPFLYLLYDIRVRKEHTLSRLNWSGGNAKSREVRDGLVASIKASPPFDLLRTPKLVSVQLYKNRDEGFLLVANWIGHAPVADGIQVTFSDGSTVNVKLGDSYLSQNQKDSKKMVLYQGTISNSDFPAPANQMKYSDVVSAALLAEDDLCSNHVEPID